MREELGEVHFGDQRLDERLLKLGEKLMEKPSFSLNQGQGDWAASKAAYRFFENDKVEVEPILQVHVSRTCERIKECGRIILAIQDTTTLDYSKFESIEGLSEIYRNQKTWKDSEGGQGPSFRPNPCCHSLVDEPVPPCYKRHIARVLHFRQDLVTQFLCVFLHFYSHLFRPSF